MQNSGTEIMRKGTGSETGGLPGFGGGARVVFFGKAVSTECQRCGAFSSTNRGHKYCAHVSCPIALKEAKRRKRKRTSTLEKVYMPRMQQNQ